MQPKQICVVVVHLLKHPLENLIEKKLSVLNLNSFNCLISELILPYFKIIHKRIKDSDDTYLREL